MDHNHAILLQILKEKKCMRPAVQEPYWSLCVLLLVRQALPAVHSKDVGRNEITASQTRQSAGLCEAFLFASSALKVLRQH